MAYNYRCSRRAACGKRKTLRHPLEWYLREPRCPDCGQHSLKFDLAPRRQTLERTCRCGGIAWPHREGTVLSDREFCHRLELYQVRLQLVERNLLSPAEASAL